MLFLIGTDRHALSRPCMGLNASCRAGFGQFQPAHAPVLTGECALAKALRTIESGTPKPVWRLVPTLAANTVASTRPSPSTTGPPELPERTSPRKDVI